MESALKSLLSVPLGAHKVPAPHATKDTPTSMESAHYHLLNAPRILDVDNGIGITKSASSAHSDLSSDLTESANQSLLNAQPGIQMEPALLASRDTTFKTEPVFWPLKTDLLTSDAPNGTGTIKFVLSAQMDSFLDLTESANQSPLNAHHGTLKVPALLASRDTTFKTELVFWPPFKDQLISDVLNGTGTIKSA